MTNHCLTYTYMRHYWCPSSLTYKSSDPFLLSGKLWVSQFWNFNRNLPQCVKGQWHLRYCWSLWIIFAGDSTGFCFLPRISPLCFFGSPRLVRFLLEVLANSTKSSALPVCVSSPARPGSTFPFTFCCKYTVHENSPFTVNKFASLQLCASVRSAVWVHLHFP